MKFFVKQKEMSNQAQEFLRKFVDQINLDYQVPLSTEDKNKIMDDIEQHTENKLNELGEQIKNEFSNGKLDHLLLAKNQNADGKLKQFMKYNNRVFITRVFLLAESKGVIDKWINEGAELPIDSIALAISLRSSKAVFEYLDDKNYFKNLSEYDRNQLLLKANKALKENKEESFNFLNEKLQANETLNSINKV